MFDAGSQLQKYSWIRKGERLLDQARDAMNSGRFPLFVAEGESEKKLNRINHSAYLYQGLKVLGSNVNTVAHCYFIHGHSLDENDDHILKRLGRGRFRKLYIGLFGDVESEMNQKIIARAIELQAMRIERYPLDLDFYDSESAGIWG